MTLLMQLNLGMGWYPMDDQTCCSISITRGSNATASVVANAGASVTFDSQTTAVLTLE